MAKRSWPGFGYSDAGWLGMHDACSSVSLLASLTSTHLHPTQPFRCSLAELNAACNAAAVGLSQHTYHVVSPSAAPSRVRSEVGPVGFDASAHRGHTTCKTRNARPHSVAWGESQVGSFAAVAG
jgi:hypothetical protein